MGNLEEQMAPVCGSKKKKKGTSFSPLPILHTNEP